MAHTAVNKRKLIARVGRLRGQLNAIEKALLEDKQCYEILMRAAACRGAMDSLMAEILEGHIRLHLLDPGPGSRSERRKAAREVIEIVNAFLR